MDPYNKPDSMSDHEYRLSLLEEGSTNHNRDIEYWRGQSRYNAEIFLDVWHYTVLSSDDNGLLSVIPTDRPRYFQPSDLVLEIQQTDLENHLSLADCIDTAAHVLRIVPPTKFPENETDDG